MLNGPTHMLPPPSVLFQSFFDKAATKYSCYLVTVCSHLSC